MEAKNVWNWEPSQHAVFEEPIIKLLMTRDRVDASALRDLWPQFVRHSLATSTQAGKG